MNRRVVCACALVLLGFAAAPVLAQPADTATTSRDEPVFARVDPAIDAEAPPAPGVGAGGDSLTAPTDSVTAPVPDPARIATLAIVLRNFDDVRVVTSGGRLGPRAAVASPDGLRLSSGRWGIGAPVHPEDRLVSWAEIESIEVRRGNGAGPVVGAALGLAVGWSIYMAQVPAAIFSFGRHQPSGTPVLVGVLSGAALGWLIDRPGRWQTVYP